MIFVIIGYVKAVAVKSRSINGRRCDLKPFNYDESPRGCVLTDVPFEMNLKSIIPVFHSLNLEISLSRFLISLREINDNAYDWHNAGHCDTETHPTSGGIGWALIRFESNAS